MSQAKLESHMPPTVFFSPVTAVEVIDKSFCKISLSDAPSLDLMWSISSLRIVLGVVLLLLAVISTLKQAVVWYKATKQWQPNHYMQLFVKDGILYFLAYVSPFPSLPFITITFSHPSYSSICKKTNHSELLGI